MVDLVPLLPARVQPPPDDDIFSDLKWWLESKRKMIERNSTRATRTCPNCGGKVNMILAGPKKHLHGACETQGCMRIME